MDGHLDNFNLFGGQNQVEGGKNCVQSFVPLFNFLVELGLKYPSLNARPERLDLIPNFFPLSEIEVQFIRLLKLVLSFFELSEAGLQVQIILMSFSTSSVRALLGSGNLCLVFVWHASLQKFLDILRNFGSLDFRRVRSV